MSVRTPIFSGPVCASASRMAPNEAARMARTRTAPISLTLRASADIVAPPVVGLRYSRNPHTTEVKLFQGRNEPGSVRPKSAQNRYGNVHLAVGPGMTLGPSRCSSMPVPLGPPSRTLQDGRSRDVCFMTVSFSTIDLNLLRVFDAVMEAPSVLRASQRVFLSQSAVSHSLARLREMLDDELFVRTSAGMQPPARALAMAPLGA